MNKIIFLLVIIFGLGFAGTYLLLGKSNLKNDIREIVYTLPTPIPTEFVQKIVEIMPTRSISRIIPTSRPILKPTDSTPWGVSQQIDSVTWTIRIGEDEKMAAPREIWLALNEYRKVHSSQYLTWDEKLASYAQTRAVYINSIKNVDQHKGFADYLENQDGFNKIGFTSLGENISFGYRLNGVHTIEWMYAGDKPHNDNQLNNKWNYVGIGVDGLATSIIFGAGKM